MIRNLGNVNFCCLVRFGFETQNIEVSWRTVRNALSRTGIRKDNLSDYLCEYMWRKNRLKSTIDPFVNLINHIKLVYMGEIDFTVLLSCSFE